MVIIKVTIIFRVLPIPLATKRAVAVQAHCLGVAYRADLRVAAPQLALGLLAWRRAHGVRTQLAVRSGLGAVEKVLGGLEALEFSSCRGRNACDVAELVVIRDEGLNVDVGLDVGLHDAITALNLGHHLDFVDEAEHVSAGGFEDIENFLS